MSTHKCKVDIIIGWRYNNGPMLENSDKRRRGRPATGTTPKRYFRMDDENYAKVVEAAEQRGETVSDFIRRALLNSVRRVNRKG